jgi:hypothetical protein
MATRIRSNIGYKRTPRSFRASNPSAAGYTDDIRQQMATIMKNLEDLIQAVEDVTPEALEYALQPIYDKSQEYVPVDTGDLKRSGYLETRQTSRGVEAEVGYGRGGRPSYAPIVHENMAFYHNPPTRSKFLETAINEHQQDILPRLIDFLRRKVGFS